MSDDAVYRDALETLILMGLIARDARHDTERRLKGFGVEVTAPQYRVLRQLEQGELTIKQLSQRMLLEPATLVPMVDALERHGFVRRTRDPRDRRRVPLALTDLGAERLAQTPYVHEDDRIARFLGQLSDGERQTFLRQLRELATALHDDDQVVRHITDAVRDHFDFGERQAARQPDPSSPLAPDEDPFQ